MMDLLAAFRVYVRVAEARSFSAVARELGATQPAISRQVAALEEHLGARLLQRTTRSLALTEDGRDLLDHARRVLDAVEDAEAAVGRRHAAPGGLVRLATPSAFGRLYVAPRMNRLLERYPELSIELIMSDEVSDLVADGIDLALRATSIADSSLVARKIGSTRRITVASEECIRAHGLPEHPRDLARLPCVIFTGRPSPNEWQFDGPDGTTMVTVNGRFRSNNSEAARVGVVSGLGYALMPIWMLGDEIASGQLRAVLTGWEPPAVAISAAYPSRRNLAPRTRAVIDFFVDEFRLDPIISDYGEV
jgi:DNA-binding transcriptional LysR family regulator